MKYTIKDIINYLVGNIRYQLYYSKFSFLIRSHIHEQIDWRVKVMKQECYLQGSCTECGCTTTALQMANKSCDKPCYPPIMNSRDWESFLAGEEVEIKGKSWKYLVDRLVEHSSRHGKMALEHHYIFLNSTIVHNKTIML